MKQLAIDLEHCFGIGKFEYEFDFSKLNSYLLYAPNGTMKTSFAKTFDLVSKKNVPKDLVYGKKSKYDIVVDGNTIKPSKILVINAEDITFDATNKITSFIASKELKEQYDTIYTELNTAKDDLLKQLKNISRSTDCEGEYTSTYNSGNFFEVLSNNINELKDDFEKTPFKYNEVFDNKGKVKEFITKNESLLDDYITNYNSLISSSKLFKISNNTFGTQQVNEIIKSIEDNAFFDAGHKFILEDGTEIKNSEELKKLVQEEIEKIFADQKLKASFDKVDKAIGANAELRTFKKVIEENNTLLIELKDYNGYKKKVWTNFLSEIKKEVTDLSKLYEEKKVTLEAIIAKTNEEIELWKEITKKFNDRFYVPFEVNIANKQDVLLKQETANLEFVYKDANEPDVKQTKENLLKILSKGEQRAYFILQFLFEIESRKLHDTPTLLIFDDIADSFDYKNKYAIIEYIKELHDSDKFKSIILTHNFDFYRTIASRLDLHKNCYIVTKNESKEITLKTSNYTKVIFKELLDQVHTDPKVFISLIPFVRNIIEYTDSSKCNDYSMLTNCLHIKDVTDTIILKDIIELYKSRLLKLHGKVFDFDEDYNLLAFIYGVADDILKETNIDGIILENKIVLAIACRLKAEQYMLNKLPELDISKLGHNQTRELSNKYLSAFPKSVNKVYIDKINLMTPENIHLNSFMYEPLIDMSITHLTKLYFDVKNMN
ncbi:AAA family ATPase [Flavobacterium sp. I3-2]|uniref:AAA family ATPase n=1 Tax=Flavobacterium sp. I3-2 TaxID=2748319 RepID=UPI0015B171EA|nr:hypothetical protein [Flavobacterium sp. I3-2]